MEERGLATMGSRALVNAFKSAKGVVEGVKSRLEEVKAGLGRISLGIDEDEDEEAGIPREEPETPMGWAARVLGLILTVLTLLGMAPKFQYKHYVYGLLNGLRI